MPKIVVNTGFGGFSLSQAAQQELGIATPYPGNDTFGIESDNYNVYRADSRLVACVEKLGRRAGGSCADLRIVEVPEGVQWLIMEYDGREWIAEQHRVWYAQ